MSDVGTAYAERGMMVTIISIVLIEIKNLKNKFKKINMKLFKTLLLGSIVLALILVSCSEDDNITPTEINDDNIPDFETGSFTDTRDGKVYKTVTIGDQTWMAEDLSFEPDAGEYEIELIDTLNNIYGYYYEWETAQVVVPDGWHIPSKDEYIVLLEYLVDNGFCYQEDEEIYYTAKSLSLGGIWNSTTVIGTPGNSDYSKYINSSGFSAIPNKGGYSGYWWTSTIHITETYYSLNIWSDRYYTSLTLMYPEFRAAIRCIKD